MNGKDTGWQRNVSWRMPRNFRKKKGKNRMDYQMNFAEFKRYIVKHIMEYFPKEFEEAEVLIVKKIQNNDTVREGLRIEQKDRWMAPVFYLDESYEQYLEGRDLDDMLSEMAKVYQADLAMDEKFLIDIPLNTLTEYDQVKDRIFCRLVNRAASEMFLQDKPFTPVEDLAVTYHIQVKTSQNAIGSIAISNNMMEMFGVNLETLHEQAISNMEKLSPTVIKPLPEMMFDLLLPDFMQGHRLGETEAREQLTAVMQEKLPDNATQIYCITNTHGINGAAGIVSPEVQQKVAEVTGGDYYILPSSIHETLAVAKKDVIRPDKLREVIGCVNGKAVSEEERLSDNVYEYNVKERTFRIADTVTQEETVSQTQEIQKSSVKLH
jgi:hypothetical protein